MKVLKFGGTSVGTPEAIKRVIEIVRTSCAESPCVIVVSAFTKVTDCLIALCATATAHRDYQQPLEELEARHFEAARELVTIQGQSVLLAQLKVLSNELADILKGLNLLGELTPRAQDLVMSFGERLSATVIGVALNSAGVTCDMLDARECIKTDNHYGCARVQFAETNEALKKYFYNKTTPTTVTGFIGSTMEGDTTTLGRGGSDYSASIIGAALNASVIEIWTDVDGVMTADPRKVSGAQYVTQMTYEEAMELSFFGAKVLYYPTVHPARERHIPLLIKNTFNPSAPGTRIATEENPRNLPVTAITSIAPIVIVQIQGAGLVGISGMAGRVFQALGKEHINIILISQASSQYSISVAIAANDADRASKAINHEFELEIEHQRLNPPIIESDLAIIAVVGSHMRAVPGIAGRIFSSVGEAGLSIRAIAQGSSELNISFVVGAKDKDEAIRAIHNEFFS